MFYFHISSRTILVFTLKFKEVPIYKDKADTSFMYGLPYTQIRIFWDQSFTEVVIVFSVAHFQSSNELNFELQLGFQVQLFTVGKNILLSKSSHIFYT